MNLNEGQVPAESRNHAFTPSRSNPIQSRHWIVAAGFFSVLITIWTLIEELAGMGKITNISTRTVDGSAVDQVLAGLIWVALAISLITAIFERRNSSRHKTSLGRETRFTNSVDSKSEQRSGIIAVLIGLVFVIIVYHGLFLPGAITWGDWGYFINNDAVSSFFPIPSLWTFSDLGAANILGAPLSPIESAMGALAHLGFSFNLLERLFFFFPALALSYWGPVLLLRRIGARWIYAAGAGSFYCVNPYILDIVSGGQMTVGMGYALYPWVAIAAIRLWSTRTVLAGMTLGLVIGIQAWYDPRTAGLSVVGLTIAGTVLVVSKNDATLHRIPWLGLGVGTLVFLLLQGPWLIPTLSGVPAGLPGSYTSGGALQTFSLMSLADGLTIFHPFWPQMKFIALYSVPPVWFVFPSLVAAALWRARRSTAVLVGISIYLVFAALVSGANAPFGPINVWLFQHAPGMNLFRDPSPFFGPAALGMAIAIGAGFSARTTSPTNEVATSQVGFKSRLLSDSLNLRGAAMNSTMMFLGASIIFTSAWPALSGDLRHNLAPQTIAPSIRSLDRKLLDSPNGAILWIPSVSRFAPESPLHPNLSAFALQETSGIGFPQISTSFSWLGDRRLTADLMAQFGISEVVVSEDASDYRALTLPYEPIVRAAIGAFTGNDSWHFSRFVLYRLASRTSYPIAVIPSNNAIQASPEQLWSSIGASRDLVTYVAPPGVGVKDAAGLLKKVHRRTSTIGAAKEQQNRLVGEELATTGFKKGLAHWFPVGNANNYLHQSLSQAGITEALKLRDGASWLHLTVRNGTAAISQFLSPCPKVDTNQLSVTYQIHGAGTLSAYVFSSNQSPPIGGVFVGGITSRWHTTSVPLVLLNSLSALRSNEETPSCLFELALTPDRAGVSTAANIRTVSLTPVKPRLLALQRQASLTPLVRTTAHGNQMSLELNRSSKAELLVFWQRFNSGWKATMDGNQLAHVIVNGWANGYVLPPSHSGSRIRISYESQRLLTMGFILMLAAIAIMSMVLAILALRTSKRRSLRSPGQ